MNLIQQITPSVLMHKDKKTIQMKARLKTIFHQQFFIIRKRKLDQTSIDVFLLLERARASIDVFFLLESAPATDGAMAPLCHFGRSIHRYRAPVG
jgi:hypothetical protein